MRIQGRKPDAAGTVGRDAIRQSSVPLTLKSDLLGALWREGGPEAVLRAGQEVGDIEYDPIWRAALRTPSPSVLFDKWRRFESYGHSTNRLRIEHTGANSAEFTRYTVHGGYPGAPENHLICGLMIGLLEAIGCTALTCSLPLRDGGMHPVRQRGRFRLPADIGKLDTGYWAISWEDLIPRAPEQETDGTWVDIAMKRDCEDADRKAVRAVLGLLGFDVARQWKIEEIARETGHSKRSLQRRLRDAGFSFSELVRMARIHDACRRLQSSDDSVTAVGFCAGFSDSAHFSRDFRASMGMSPSQFRKLA